MKLPLNAKIDLVEIISNDFADFAKSNQIPPDSLTYKVASVRENHAEKIAARLAAFSHLKPTKLVKLAFDTRRIDQENDRNPRQNLQYWHRTDQFIDENDKDNLEIFSKLAKVLNKLKNNLGTQPDWFESYSRQLYDNVNRILRVKQADMDIFRPQLSYLEQLIYARYRLSMDDLKKNSESQIEEIILAKDENLIGRNNYMKDIDENKIIKENSLNKTIEKTTQESIVNAIFGTNQNIRKDGEKTVERTITITIRDNVVE